MTAVHCFNRLTFFVFGVSKRARRFFGLVLMNIYINVSNYGGLSKVFQGDDKGPKSPIVLVSGGNDSGTLKRLWTGGKGSSGPLPWYLPGRKFEADMLNLNLACQKYDLYMSFRWDEQR
jgi:hypothetical protein